MARPDDDEERPEERVVENFWAEMEALDAGLPEKDPPAAEEIQSEPQAAGAQKERPAHDRYRPDPRPVSKERSYPLHRALLSDPKSVPYGSEPLISSRAPPVSRTFFPNRPIPKRRQLEDTARLDSLLEVMADGLLVGGDEQGRSEIRITLRDDFFRGTELRVAADNGQVIAILMPPDREVYETLKSEADRLQTQLEDRGLRVAQVLVEEP